MFNKLHMLTPSPWPPFISFIFMNFFLSMLFFMKMKMFFFFIIYFLMLLFSSFCWWNDIIKENNTGHHNFDVLDGLKLSMLLFISSEVFFFAAWFWAFFHSSLNPSNMLGNIWPPHYISTMDPFKVPLLNTGVLLSSGVTVTWSHYNIITNKKSNLSLMFTIFLGAVFTLLQLMEYYVSFFCISENIFGGSFFVTTGFHGVHVLVGSIFLFYCLNLMNKNQLNKWQHLSYEMSIWYWHFVDVIWLFLFIFMYWWSF